MDSRSGGKFRNPLKLAANSCVVMWCGQPVREKSPSTRSSDRYGLHTCTQDVQREIAAEHSFRYLRSRNTPCRQWLRKGLGPDHVRIRVRSRRCGISLTPGPTFRIPIPGIVRGSPVQRESNRRRKRRSRGYRHRNDSRHTEPACLVAHEQTPRQTAYPQSRRRGNAASDALQFSVVKI